MNFVNKILHILFLCNLTIKSRILEYLVILGSLSHQIDPRHCNKLELSSASSLEGRGKFQEGGKQENKIWPIQDEG